ncbi:MAG: hypothetical protein WC459_01725 [Patescibacteria group bacterium]
MDWKRLREANMLGIGIRAFKPCHRRQKSLAEKIAEEYAEKICKEIMEPHYKEMEVWRELHRKKNPPKTKRLTPELKKLAEKLLERLNTGESISRYCTAYGGDSMMRHIIKDITIYGSCSSHWGSGYTELTVFKNENCIFACVLEFSPSFNVQDKSNIRILRCPDSLEDLKQI